MQEEDKIIADVDQNPEITGHADVTALTSEKRGHVKQTLIEQDTERKTRISPLRERLTADLAGIADVSTPEWLPEKLERFEMHAIDIKDKEAMRSAKHLRKFLPYVGRLYYETFQDRDKEESNWNPNDPDFLEMVVKEYFVNCDLSFAEKIYLISENGEVKGLYFLKYRTLPNGKRIAAVIITTLDRPCRGTMVNELISRTVFENEKVHAFSAVTHTPALVKSWIRLGTMTDMDVYYCGRKNGNKNEPISERERQNLTEILKHDIDKLRVEYECREMPSQDPHYLNFGTASIPPRRLSEVRLSPDDPVFQTFKELISYQEENAPDECMFGTIILVRKD